MTKSTDKPNSKSDRAAESDLLGRDLIYIETDDEVISIVEKIKSSPESVVALVAPKRIGVLQSAVNLKLLKRAAKQSRKQLAIVTTDVALSNLASGLSIPIARTVNSHAKLLEAEQIANDPDVIEGEDFTAETESIGDKSDKEIEAAVKAIETDDRISGDYDGDGEPDEEPRKSKPKARSDKPSIKVPNINNLRKKIIIGSAVGAVLIAFLVWAIVFAPKAVISIKAKTSAIDSELTMNLNRGGGGDSLSAAPIVKQKKTTDSVQFSATGQKEVGEKATGQVAFCYAKDPYNSRNGNKNAINIPAGTRLYFSGVQFTTDSDVTVEGGLGERESSCGSSSTYYSVRATAVNVGEDSNISKGSSMEVSGYSVSAVAKTDFTGGSKKIVKIVQQSDIDGAIAKIKSKSESENASEELKSQMPDSAYVFDGSYTVSQSNPKPSVSVGAEAEGGATLTMETTYTLVGVAKDDIKKMIESTVNGKINKSEQKIYSDGLSSVKVASFQEVNGGYSASIKFKAYVGPIIDDKEIKKMSVGKKAGEISAKIKELSGVDSVDVKMSPFWVTKAPAENKITVNFTVDE